MMTELLLAATFPVCQLAGLALLGWALRVDRKR